ncbi:AMP-binding protein [Amycolatopsis sp. NPDC059021]|uniref:AMP-binding protein n=1 Tax=Amycolatopsis sp. NPDC059021 TaxID=3346704 RepID=UPI00366B4512
MLATPPIAGPGSVPPALLARTHGAAEQLVEHGIGEGSRVAIDAPDTLAWFLGADLVGAAALIVEPGWSARERAAVLADAAPDLVVTGEPGTAREGVTPAGDGRTWFALPTTSGSSGAPKVLARTRDSWLDSFAALGPLDGPVLIPGPLSSSLFLFGALHAFWCGQDVELLPRWDPAAAARAATRTASVHLVPAMLTGLLAVLDRQPETRAACTLKTIVCGGAHVDAADRARLAALVPETEPLFYYGSAEHSLIAVERGGGGLRVVPGVDVEIRDGILWVDSPLAHSARLDGGVPRYVHKGFSTVDDRAEFDETGALVIHGRAGSMVSSGGKLVACEEVEAVLRAVPGVADVLVAGTPHRTLGSLVTAVVETTDTSSDVVRALRTAARTELEPGKRPRRWLAVKELPRTAAGKPARAAVAAMLRNGGLAAEPL